MENRPSQDRRVMGAEPADPSNDEPLGWWVRLPEAPADVDFRRHRIELNELLQAAFIDGAEEHSLRTKGRGISDEELRKALDSYPGDMTIQPWSCRCLDVPATTRCAVDEAEGRNLR
jgi:hypothetical protein